jgi:hypothetical protein
MDGFYAAFLTGRGGNSIILLAIKSGSIIGVDIAGLKYDGSIETAADGNVRFHINYVIQPGTQLITGVGGVGTTTPVSLDFTAPADFASGIVIAIQTPFGPVNAKITKLRDFDFGAS